MIMDTLGLGPSLVFREVSFDKIGNTATTFEYKETVPSVDLIFTFM